LNGENIEDDEIPHAKISDACSLIGRDNKVVKLLDITLPDQDKYDFFLVKRDKRSTDSMILNMITVDNTTKGRISLGDTTPTDIKFSISARSTEVGRSSTIIRSQFRILVIIYLTYTVFYMAFPSVLFMHFTMNGHYYHIIKSYEDHGEEAARNFMTIYVFTILFGARLGGHLIDFKKMLFPNWCMKLFLGPLLTMMRIYIVANFYISLWKTRDIYFDS